MTKNYVGKYMPDSLTFNDTHAIAFDCKSKTITFIVTENCQLRCTYCYEKGKNCKHDMDFETGKKIVDFLFEQDAKHSELINEDNAYTLILDFIGGEPLLRIDLIDKILKYFVKKAIKLNHRWATQYRVSFSTNGVAFFEPKVQEFLKFWGNQVSMTVSIDGNKELHDACRRFADGKPSFDIAEKAFKECLRRGLTNSTKLTIAPGNLKYLSTAMINMFESYPLLKSLPANPVFEEMWTIEQAQLYYQELKKVGQWFLDTKHYLDRGTTLFSRPLGTPMPEDDNRNWCGGTGEMLAFDYKGDIYPCLRYVPFTLTRPHTKSFALGNVHTGWLKSEREQKAIKCLQCITRRSQSTDKCFNCPIAQGCAWCSGWNFDFFDDPNKRYTGICNMHKAATLANVWFWNELYKKEGLTERRKLYIPDEWALDIIDEDELNYIKANTKTEEEK